MIDFKPITLEARGELLPFLGRKHHSACYQSFATMYLWSGIYQTQYCLTGDFMFTRNGSGGYSFPYGDGDLKEGIALLRRDAADNGRALWFFGLLEEQKAWLEQNYPGEFTYTASRDDAEYIYEAKKLATYAGKKLHGKRNFCNRFEAAHPDWKFERITAENREAVLEFHRQWCAANEGGDEGLHKEGCVVRCALRHLDELEMTGGVLTAGGKIYGFAVASMINETIMDENIEKADGEEPGAYPMVCREMTRMMMERYPDLTLVNREEDTGDEGLRRSKLSYYPVMLLDKYVTKEQKKP